MTFAINGVPLRDIVRSRDCILLGLPGADADRAEYVRHRAVNGHTLCGVELGGSIPDPPDLVRDDVRSCKRCIPDGSEEER